MVIKLYFHDFPVSRVTFAYSVLHELLLSLYILDSIKQHPLHITWAIDTLKQLPHEFNAERCYFRVILQEVISLIWKPFMVETPSFESELAGFSRVSLDCFVEPLLTVITSEQAPARRRAIGQLLTWEEFHASTDLQAKAVMWLQTYYPESIGIVDSLLLDAEAFKTRFIRMIEQYWSLIFHDFWDEWESYFLSEIQNRGQLVYREGVLSGLANLAPRTYIDHEAESVSFVSHAQGVDLHFNQDNYLHLVPSYFLYPGMMFHVYLTEHAEAQSLSITYPIPEIQQLGRSPIPSDDLVTMLRGLSDPTRLQILQLVAQKARSTGEIAKIIGLSDAAISKHLKLLQQAGWVTSERNSYYVLYRAIDAPLDDLNFGLRRLLAGDAD